MKTKMNFSDIVGMLERDEMREIMGGEYATTIIPPESYDDSMRIPELTPSGPVFGTPGKISAPLPGYSTPTYQGGELNAVVIGPRNNSSTSNSYGSFQLGGGYNSSYSIGYASGYGGVGGSSNYSTSSGITNYEPLLRFFADVLEDFGSATEIAGILAAPFTEGTSLSVASAGTYIGFIGTLSNSGLDIYFDGNYELAELRIATFIATYGLGKALDKALITGELAGSEELAIRLGTLIYGEAWANQIKGK